MHLEPHQNVATNSTQDLASQAAAKVRLQLPKKLVNGVWIEEPTCGRFKCVDNSVLGANITPRGRQAVTSSGFTGYVEDLEQNGRDLTEAELRALILEMGGTP
jgi:hypothetical protein